MTTDSIAGMADLFTLKGRVALITLITPVTALLLGQSLNHERIPPSGWLGIALIGTGLVLYEWQALRRLK